MFLLKKILGRPSKVHGWSNPSPFCNVCFHTFRGAVSQGSQVISGKSVCEFLKSSDRSELCGGSHSPLQLLTLLSHQKAEWVLLLLFQTQGHFTRALGQHPKETAEKPAEVTCEAPLLRQPRVAGTPAGLEGNGHLSRTTHSVAYTTRLRDRV